MEKVRGAVHETVDAIKYSISSILSTKPMVYILASQDQTGIFYEHVVGYSDIDVLSDDLLRWVTLIEGERDPENDEERCVLERRVTFFNVEYADSPREAWKRACEIWHSKETWCHGHPIPSKGFDPKTGRGFHPNQVRCPKCNRLGGSFLGEQEK